MTDAPEATDADPDRPANSDATDEPATSSDDPEPEKPPVDDDATVDLDAVDAAIDDATDEDGDEAVEADDETDAEPEPTEELGGKTFGDHYVNGLCAVSNAVIDKYSDESGEGVDESMARQLELDDAMDEWIRSKGLSEEMAPGQQLIVCTLMFLVAAVASNPAVVDNLASEGVQ